MEAQILRCGSCGAPIPVDAVQCPYCQGQAATVACPKCLGMVALSAKHCPQCGAAVDVQEHGLAGLKCPECKEALMKASVGGVDLSQCHRCGGVWLSRELFARVAADREERGAILGALPGGQAKGVIAPEIVHYRPCPECSRMMNRTNYGRISGAILDTCKDHGVWFDKDELRRVLGFIQMGGLEKAREHQLRELEDQKRLALASRPTTPPEWEGQSSRSGPGLLDLLEAMGGLIDRIKR